MKKQNSALNHDRCCEGHTGHSAMSNMDHSRHDHSHGSHNHGGMVADFRKRFWISLVLSVPILALSPMIQNFLGLGDSIRFTGDIYILFVLSAVVFVYGGWPFLKGLVDELRTKQPGMMTLVAVAVSVAFFYSSAVVFGLAGKLLFWELATLIDVMLLGHWIEMRSVMAASGALEELAKLLPSLAHRINRGGVIEDVALEKLNVGDKVLIKPGEKIPVDGKVFEGETSVNESMLTGESKPVFRGIGSQVIGGSINGEGSIKIEILKTGKDSYISQVIELVRKAQESKSKTQNLANRAAVWLTIIALSAGTITLLVWLVILGHDLSFALERTVTVIAITCPHALGLAIPLVVSVTTALSARHGFLIKNRTSFEEARDIDTIIFDKTGTLTLGQFGVTDIIVKSGYKENDILSYAASLESRSEHPLAKAIVKKAKDKKIKLKEVQKFESTPGKGIEGKIGKNLIMIAGHNWLREKKIEPKLKLGALEGQGKTIVYVIINNDIVGAIAMADLVRKESRQAIRDLKKMGLRTLMITGDNKIVAKSVAKQLGLDDFFAEVLPNDKSEAIKKVQLKGAKVAMVGDGVNDAPALVQANVGIAIGAGTDVAIESADVILVKDDPRDVVSTIKLAKATYSKMRQNLFWATGYNVVAIPLAAGVLYNFGILLSPAIGAILMSASTVIVAINARFLSIK